MASKDDRKTLTTLAGMPPISSASVSVIPQLSDRWNGRPAMPIMTPSSRPMGNTAVTNPYLMALRPQLAKGPARTNPTAEKTFLSRKVTPKSTVRHSRASLGTQRPSNTLMRDKGKGRASESRPPPSYEIIDVDAEPASTDDLDLLPPQSPSTSRFFDSPRNPNLSTNGRDGPIARPSLIGDGVHTNRLRANHGDPNRTIAHERSQVLQQRESSPIDSFSEDETKANDHSPDLKQSYVKKMAAEIDERELRMQESEPVPIINFRKKDRMQPKHKSHRLKFITTPYVNDVLSDPSRLRAPPAKSKLSDHRLPISAMFIGRQELHGYDTLVLRDDWKWMHFEGRLNRRFGPISISPRNFSGFQYTNPQDLNDTIHSPIFYFQTAQTPSFGNWVASFDSAFRPGDGNRGQIAMEFDTSDKQWDSERYSLAVQKVVHLLSAEAECEALRPRGGKLLWDTLVSGAKFHSGDPTILSDSVYEGAKLVSKSSTRGPGGSLSNEASSRNSRVDELQKFRHSPASYSAVSTRKRPSNPSKEEENAAAEITILEPPPKRQRVEGSRPLRRSARQQDQQEKSPSCDVDEVILVYPYGVPGAVNVTAGDLARLQPDEFLNDTLIEFGLKSWLKELEATDPDIASQVHVFNSFFYKKLNKRNIKEGYESVRKWTSKIDIFSKRYVVVPINEHLHWYLAIIYEPEHILQTPPPSHTPHTNAVTRRQAQAQETQAAEDVVGVQAETPLEPEAARIQLDVDEDVPDGANSENEVEELAFAASCSITTTNEHSSTMSSASEAKAVLIRASLDNEKSLDAAPGSPMKIDNDLPLPDVAGHPSRSDTSDATMGSGAQTPIEISDSQQTHPYIDGAITPAKFYRKSYLNQSRKKARKSVEEPIIIDEKPRTKIFILDSLGNRHPQAMKQLNKWLELEAMDKKKVESITPAITKMTPVPVQPNFCDCGLYILHFTKTFMSDPQRYCQIIMTKERPPMGVRKEDWADASVKTMRDELRAKILSFSDDWRLQRAAREEEKKQKQAKEDEEDEDSDVAIVEHVKTPGKKGKSTRTKT